MAIGHSCLHKLLTRSRNDRHALRNDLQLACGLTLSLDHYSQTLVPTLSSLGELCELGQSEFDLTLLWSWRSGRLWGLGLVWCGEARRSAHHLSA